MTTIWVAIAVLAVVVVELIRLVCGLKLLVEQMGWWNRQLYGHIDELRECNRDLVAENQDLKYYKDKNGWVQYAKKCEEVKAVRERLGNCMIFTRGARGRTTGRLTVQELFRGAA